MTDVTLPLLVFIQLQLGTIRPSTAAKYLSVLVGVMRRMHLEVDQQVIKDYRNGLLNIESDLGEEEHALPLPKHTLLAVLRVLPDFYWPIRLMWQTASRWDDMSGLSKSRIKLTTLDGAPAVLLDFDGHTKTTRYKPAARWRSDHYVLVPIKVQDVTSFREWLQVGSILQESNRSTLEETLATFNPPLAYKMEHKNCRETYTLHSIKSGALTEAARAAATIGLDEQTAALLISRLAKHLVQHPQGVWPASPTSVSLSKQTGGGTGVASRNSAHTGR